MLDEIDVTKSLRAVAVDREVARLDEQPKRPDRLVSNEAVAFRLDASQQALGGSFGPEAGDRLGPVNTKIWRARRVRQHVVHRVERRLSHRDEGASHGLSTRAGREKRDQPRNQPLVALTRSGTRE